ncbi:uncharacterized protein [Lepeophtheirus salmonis]|uniref:uncharacterized protein isoform X1 n=1 Tax=Lepeophtheirus salmonis TaxID=72036 RepID=UPI001AEA6C0D|nr:uncharacterized protein LOC121132665 isoform X1 [Lepeophtheirus salmonis]
MSNGPIVLLYISTENMHILSRFTFLITSLLNFKVLYSQTLTSLYSTSDANLNSPTTDVLQFPGHLKQFASHHPRNKILEKNGFMETPVSFIKKYVEPKRPVLFKKIENDLFGQTEFRPEINLLGKSGRAFLSYLTTPHGSSRSLYDSLNAKLDSQSSFIPTAMKTEIELPSILKDSNVIDKLVSTNYILMNSTFSFPLKESDTNKLICQIEGTKEVLIIDKAHDFSEYDNFVGRISEKHDQHPGDIINYAEVDYQKFSELLGIKRFYISKLEPKSCLFIPSNWIIQATSFELDHSFEINFKDINDLKQNLEKNSKLPRIMTLYDCIWPKEGIYSRPPVKSRDKYRISMDKFIHTIEHYVITPEEDINFERFLARVKNDTEIAEYQMDEWKSESLEEVEQLFMTLDINKDLIINEMDFRGLPAKVMDKVRLNVFFIIGNIVDITYDYKIDSLGPIESTNPRLNIQLLIQSQEVDNKKKYLESLNNGHTTVNAKDEL